MQCFGKGNPDADADAATRVLGSRIKPGRQAPRQSGMQTVRSGSRSEAEGRRCDGRPTSVAPCSMLHVACSLSKMVRDYRVWTAEEEGALREGVKKHGLGAWEAIRKDAQFSPLE